MNIRALSTKLIAFSLAFLFTLVLSSSIAAAQTGDDDLRSTIRAAILSDSRSQGMSPAEIDAMVEALTRQAQSVGMTAQDIVWRPTEAAPVQQQEACTGFLCNLNKAFGFDGSDYTIPIWLAASALMLIFLIAGVLEYRHAHRKKMLAQAQQGTQDGMMGQ